MTLDEDRFCLEPLSSCPFVLFTCLLSLNHLRLEVFALTNPAFPPAPCHHGWCLDHGSERGHIIGHTRNRQQEVYLSGDIKGSRSTFAFPSLTCKENWDFIFLFTCCGTRATSGNGSTGSPDKGQDVGVSRGVAQ